MVTKLCDCLVSHTNELIVQNHQLKFTFSCPQAKLKEKKRREKNGEEVCITPTRLNLFKFVCQSKLGHFLFRIYPSKSRRRSRACVWLTRRWSKPTMRRCCSEWMHCEFSGCVGTHCRLLQVQLDASLDEFASYFDRSKTPKILITTSDRPTLVIHFLTCWISDRVLLNGVLYVNFRGLSFMHTDKMFQRTKKFCYELRNCLPNSVSKYRRGLDLKRIIPQAIARDFTDIIVVNEDQKKPSKRVSREYFLSKNENLKWWLSDGLVLTHLPDGPTAHFKLTNLKFRKEIRVCNTNIISICNYTQLTLSCGFVHSEKWRADRSPTGSHPQQLQHSSWTQRGSHARVALPARTAVPRSSRRDIPQSAWLHLRASPSLPVQRQQAVRAAGARTALHAQAAIVAERNLRLEVRRIWVGSQGKQCEALLLFKFKQANLNTVLFLFSSEKKWTRIEENFICRIKATEP